MFVYKDNIDEMDEKELRNYAKDLKAEYLRLVEYLDEAFEIHKKEKN